MEDDRQTDRAGSRRMLGIGLAAGALALLVLFGLIGLLLIYTGAYNVAATEEHTSVTRWAFDTTIRNSVESRAADVETPANFTPAMTAAGASAYKAMCQHCHGGPGVDRAEWASGMRPTPPHLVEAAAHWEPNQIFWLIKHGIKMSGMPALGPTHDDQALWSITAFVRELPAMTPESYASLGNGGQQQGSHHNDAPDHSTQ